MTGLRSAGCWIAAATLALTLVAPAGAQDRTVRIIVPFAAGAVQDTLARSFNTELGAALGQTVIVEDKAGAGGTIGTALVAKAPPDGQTLVMAAASHVIARYLYGKIPYDPIGSFAPAAYAGLASYVLMVPADLPVSGVADFIRLVKAAPGKYNYASAGNGSATHLSMASFAGMAGLEMEHIPTKSTGEAVMEILSGRSQAVIAASIAALGYQQDKRVKLLAVTSAERSQFLPQVPTVAESGLPGYEFTSWFGLLAPAGTPAPVLDRLQNAMAGLLKDPDMLARLARQGIEPAILTNAQFAEVLRKSDAQMAEVVRKSGATVQ